MPRHVGWWYRPRSNAGTRKCRAYDASGRSAGVTAGITANAEVLQHYIERTIGTVTALNPVIGYERATALAAEALKTGEGIVELIREKHILTDDQINEILDPSALTGAGR